MFGLGVSVLEQGLIFGIMALGVYITYRILNFPDLSVDGTFTLGAFIVATLLINGVNPYLATIYASLGGMLAGLVTGILHVYLKITNLLSGILVMIGLYSLNLRISGKKPNMALFNVNTIYENYNKLIIIIIAVVLVKIVLDLFLKTNLGMVLRTTGDNPKLITSLGVDIGFMKLIGLMLSNGLVAFAGAMLAQQQRFVEIGMGMGTIVVGLAAVIIGETIFGQIRPLAFTSTVILGALVYKISQIVTYQLGFEASDFKLISALLIVTALGIHNRKDLFKIRNKRKNKKSSSQLKERGEIAC
ncbi:ABC transporter permease [Haloplasma contractile]|uniref:ABC transporter permease protein n=1 Tax=Haloplasma contractile SSD-17B TaxID=1033810 RepID=U2E8E8_9MOLU|nr:ABC transporter [Haloplasma contractile]ERJ11166.1 ABC transporter permease protein [Haloplasma contractile SSD-17B]